jgi:hypothetical protein
MTGFNYHSGYDIIRPNHIIEKIRPGENDNYNFYLDRRLLSFEKVTFIDSFYGPVRGVYGWNNFNKMDLENTFNVNV